MKNIALEEEFPQVSSGGSGHRWDFKRAPVALGRGGTLTELWWRLAEVGFAGHRWDSNEALVALGTGGTLTEIWWRWAEMGL